MTDINEDYLFKVDLPGPDSIHAHLHAIAYVRRDEVLALFEEEYDNTFGPHILQTFYPEPLPLKSHKTVVDYSKYLMEVLGRSHITVRVPLGDQVADILHKSRDFQQSLSQKNVEVGGLQNALRRKETDHERLSKELRQDRENHKYSMAELEKRLTSNLTSKHAILVNQMQVVIDDLEKRLSERDNHQYALFRGNLLLDVIQKLLPNEVNKAHNKAHHTTTVTKWSKLAGDFKEKDFKRATKGLPVSKDSAWVMEVFQEFQLYVNERNEAAHETKFELARMLTCSLYYEKGDNRLWRNLFEYAYGETAEKAVGHYWGQTSENNRYQSYEDY